MPKWVTNKRGHKIPLLNPADKGRKFAREVSTGVRHSVRENGDLTIKHNQFGESIPLTDRQLAYRSGYLAARQDSADVYNSKHNPSKLKAMKDLRKKRFEEKRAGRSFYK